MDNTSVSRNNKKIILHTDLKVYKFEDNNPSSPPCHRGLMSMIEQCYSYHIPLYLDPRAVWVNIVYQLHLLIIHNAELVRSTFVNHMGKKRLMCASACTHEKLISQLVVMVRSNMKNDTLYDWIYNTRFSTHKPETDDVVLNLLFLGSLNRYFDYTCTLCGLPEINFLGTVADWRLIRDKLDYLLEFVDKLPKFGVRRFYDDMCNMMEKIIAEKENPDTVIDQQYWMDFVRRPRDGSSGLTYINGHVCIFGRFYVPHGHNELHEHQPDEQVEMANFSTDCCEVHIDIVDDNNLYLLEAGNLKTNIIEENNTRGLTIEPDYKISIQKKKQL